MHFPSFSRRAVIATAATLTAGVTAVAGVGVAQAHHTVEVDVDGVSRQVSGFSRDVSDVLASVGVAPATHDAVYPELDAPIADGDQITVRSASEYTLQIDGDHVKTWSTATSAADVLEDIEASGRGALLAADRSEDRAMLPAATKGTVVKVDDGDKVVEVTAGAADDAKALLEKADVDAGALDRVAFTKSDDGDVTLQVTRVTRGERTTEQVTPRVEERKDDPELEKGEEKVVEEGSDGIVRTTYYTQKAGDEVLVDEKVGEQVVSEMKPKIIHVGTKEPEPEVTETESSSGSSYSSAPVGVPVPAGEAQEIAYAMLPEFGFGEDQFGCLVNLWNKESGWNYLSYNSSSGAGGIPQALPASKMASAGADWATNPATQIRWGLGYISGRYGNPCGAWGHFTSNNWY